MTTPTPTQTIIRPIVDPAELSLPELRALRAEWLRQAQDAGMIARMIEIAHTLGSRRHLGGLELCELTIPYAGDLLHVVAYRGPWSARAHEELVVSVGRADWRDCPPVCRALATASATGWYDPARGYFFIAPGEWIDCVLALAPRAEDVIIERAQEAAERERQFILEQLWLTA